jgi:hypothetical protein
VIQLVFYQLFAATLTIPLADKLILFFLILVSLGISTFYITYATNCMVVGDCNVFAWIIAAFVIFSVVFAMLSTILSVMLEKRVSGGNIPADVVEFQRSTHPKELFTQNQDEEEQ